MSQKDERIAAILALAKFGMKKYPNATRCKCGHTSKIRDIFNNQCYACAINKQLKNGVQSICR